MEVDRKRIDKFKRELFKFEGLYKESKRRFSLSRNKLHPCLNDNTASTEFDRHYIYHTAWAFRKILEFMPNKHIDISSNLYFSTLLSSLIPVDFYDFRPPSIFLEKLTTHRGDLNKLPFEDGSQESVSCMHVIEHIGLGRYGDPIDPDGDLKAIAELKRSIKKKGNLLFVVPVGKPVILFNAHRIYEHNQILQYFNSFKLIEFCLIPDNPTDGGLIIEPAEDLISKQKYGCGCYWFQKK